MTNKNIKNFLMKMGETDSYSLLEMITLKPVWKLIGNNFTFQHVLLLRS